MVRRGDDDRVDVAGVQEPAEVLVLGHHAAARVGQGRRLPEEGLVDVADGHAGDVGLFQEPLPHRPPASAAADETDADPVVGAEDPAAAQGGRHARRGRGAHEVPPRRSRHGVSLRATEGEMRRFPAR